MENFKKVNDETLMETKRLEVASVTYKSSESEFTHTIIKSVPSVAVLVINEDNELALIKQFRSTTGEYFIEVPAGLLNEGETIEEAAAREAREESGLVIKEVKRLNKSCNYLDPSKSNEDFGSAVAKVERIADRHLDENEKIDSDVIWMPMSEVKERLKKQLVEGEPFFEGLYMSGHSTDTLLQYFFINS